MQSGTFGSLGLWLCVGPLASMALANPAPPAAARPYPAWADRGLLPEAYGILTSERVMFPDDVSDWPLEIDSTHQLFVDDYLISEIEHLTREFHQPTKHPGNPLMPGGYVGVLHDADQGRFRMWYGLHYLTSSDGVHWEKPPEAATDSLLASDGGELRGFMYNPDLPEQEGRYKAVVERRYSEGKKEPGGFYLYHSRDGIRWERWSPRPILARSTNIMKPCEFRPAGAGVPAEFEWGVPTHFQGNGVGDTSTFRYDTVLKRYIFDGKYILMYPPDKIRQLGIVPEPDRYHLRLRTFSESEDLIHWSPPSFLMYPDRLDPPDRQIYAHVGFVYESMWMGVIQAMCVQPTGWKQVDLRLSYSRDGRHWLRPQHREAFIPLGNADSWEADYSGIAYTAPALVGDELFFYYFGSRNPQRDKDPERRWPTYLGLARLRRDGFASLNAGDTPGQMLSRPLRFRGTTLFVNAEVADGGWVKAAVLSETAQPVDGYGLDQAVPLTQATTRGRMSWMSRPAMEPCRDDHQRILLQLEKAKLYSFWIE